MESRYHCFELETLAVIYALRRFSVYLKGIHFKIITDCNALKLALDEKDINSRIERWSAELESSDKVFEHRCGEKIKHVNALSRVINVMIVDENMLESNLAICQNLDVNVGKLRDKLQSAEDKLYEIRNSLIYRKRDGNILFYVPESMKSNVIRKYHDEMGHFDSEKTCEAILRNYWFPRMSE